MKKTDKNYQELVAQISETYQQGRRDAVAAVNSSLVDTYWKIGQYIVEFEQGGKVKPNMWDSIIAKSF